MKVKNEQAKAVITSFTGEYQSNFEKIQNEIGINADVFYHEFTIEQSKRKAAIFYLDGFSNKDKIDKYIIQPLISSSCVEAPNNKNIDSLPPTLNYLKEKVLPLSDTLICSDFNDSMAKVMSGKTLLLIDHFSEVLIISTDEAIKRTIQEPGSETVVRGPRIGFNENLKDNLTILRQQGTNKHLKFLDLKVGEQVERTVVIAYMHNIANSELVEEVKERISKIKIDDLSESGYIEQLIEDNPLSIFPQVQSTERPDRVTSALLQGRVAILLEGTPFVLIAPVTFSMLLQSPEDNYERWVAGGLVQVLRIFAAILSLLGPSLYIAFVSFHPGLVPTKLAITIVSTREGVPFPPLIEALIMEVAIEILREAGLRLPKVIGSTISIVGGLIIGEAAVQAGLVSPFMIIVVAVTAISSFAIPQYNLGFTLRILRFFSMFAAGLLGLYGVILFVLLVLSHLVNLKSFGVYYLSPIVPYQLSDWKDLVIRLPLKFMTTRPKILATRDRKRQG